MRAPRCWALTALLAASSRGAEPSACVTPVRGVLRCGETVRGRLGGAPAAFFRVELPADDSVAAIVVSQCDAAAPAGARAGAGPGVRLGVLYGCPESAQEARVWEPLVCGKEAARFPGYELRELADAGGGAVVHVGVKRQPRPSGHATRWADGEADAPFVLTVECKPGVSPPPPAFVEDPAQCGVSAAASLSCGAADGADGGVALWSDAGVNGGVAYTGVLAPWEERIFALTAPPLAPPLYKVGITTCGSEADDFALFDYAGCPRTRQRLRGASSACAADGASARGRAAPVGASLRVAMCAACSGAQWVGVQAGERGGRVQLRVTCAPVDELRAPPPPPAAADSPRVAGPFAAAPWAWRAQLAAEPSARAPGAAGAGAWRRLRAVVAVGAAVALGAAALATARGARAGRADAQLRRQLALL
ncbi:hypothetical protein KFE25_005039 [Diacronema lutheri]|uniref:Uncharacterized protein n=2 Tax=Diacronema lutheri TaxID=2081491 RepID=A0A8J5X3P4_DIALT|nr:hypothetical protein KFE25_005039 [Diacronema lutheri]